MNDSKILEFYNLAQKLLITEFGSLEFDTSNLELEVLGFSDIEIIDINTIQGRIDSTISFDKLTKYDTNLMEDELEVENQNERGEVRLIYKDGQWNVDSLIDGDLPGNSGGTRYPRQ